jgi:hypothetical protein
VISALENSNKFQKIRFWKEKSVENMVTLGPKVVLGGSMRDYMIGDQGNVALIH